MVRRVVRTLFRSIYVALIFAALVISGLLFYFGPLLSWGDWQPLVSVSQRLWAIGILWGVVLLICLTILGLRIRRDRKLAADLEENVAVPEETADDIAQSEVAELRTKLREAMSTLRKSKDGRRHLRELPWYVMIGPPGAGKTTAIVNSGLKFPLAETHGRRAVSGAGGTRNCEWWFTEGAVLIDTAGRYTTQESDAQIDNAAWLGFLGLLKKHRTRQPINGAMVAISLSDLVLQDEQTRAGHARAVRRRLNELREQLGVRFPVYVIFTKADLIAGFSEFFETLGKEDREQVWGFTLPLDTPKAQAVPLDRFDEEYAQLLERLNAQLLERLQSETDHERRSLIAGFPSQMASMRRVARDFLRECFEENSYEARHLLRGVYLTSGTQEGTPIDRLMMGMARTFGIGRQAIGTGRGTGRSFFLTRLFEGVMFPEAGLVSADDKIERRYRVAKWSAIAATVLIASALGGMFVRSFLGNTLLVAQARTHADAYQEAAAQLPPSPIGDTDLVPVAEALNQLRDMPTNPVLDDPEPEGRLTWGLYQGEIIGTAAAQTYRAALNQRLLPRLLLRLEEQMIANTNNPDVLYEALKVYLMLGLEGPMNADLVRTWMTLDWSVAYPGPNRTDLRADLSTHLTAMLSQPMQKVELNGPLVESVQGILAEMPLAQRVYNGILVSDAAQDLEPFRITDVGGPAVTRVLTRSSGKRLQDGIEGIFTYDGFHDVLLPEALGVAKRVQRDSWVLGPRAQAEQSEAVLAALTRDVLDLYYDDYIARYDTLLGDIDIVPLESLPHAVEVTNVLSGPTSPIVNILEAVSEETKLAEDRNLLTGDTPLGEGLSNAADLELRSALDVQTQILVDALRATAEGSSEPIAPPGTYVQERFAWLHQLVASIEGQPSQLDGLAELLREVYNELNRMSFSGQAASAESGGALRRFQDQAKNVEGPLARWATQVSTGSSGIAADGTRASINARWQSAVLPFCKQVTENRYPFTQSARADVAMADFTRLFAPDGLLDTFFKENLARHVDRSTRPWSWKPADGTDLGISPAVLEQFQHAEEIRQAFFPQGPTPAVQFQVTPEALDPKAQAVLFEVDGQRMTYQHGGGLPTPLAVTWPGAVGIARVAFAPQSQSVETILSRDGPWAAFRLFDAAEIRNTNVSDRKRVVFKIGGKIAIFGLQSGSVLNPFSLSALSKFTCPSSF